MTDPSPVNSEQTRNEHALAIGKIAIAWNSLHEDFAGLFARLFQNGDYGLARIAWHSLRNDSAQREMLRSVAEAKLGNDAKAYKEIKWILKQIKGQIADQRNIGVHMPLMSYTDMTRPEELPRMSPLYLFGNRRAKAMHGKDLLKEYQHYETQIRKLNTYLIAIEAVIFAASPQSWPDRPQLQPDALN